MPYLLLIIGIILAVFGFYRFFSKASPKQIVNLIGAVMLVSFSLGMFYLAATGRLHAAIATVGALYPWAVTLYKWRKARNTSSESQNSKSSLSVKEAFEILNLDKDATKKEIEKAYKELMKKHHPDHDGSEYFAQKLNEARDLLLRHLDK